MAMGSQGADQPASRAGIGRIDLVLVVTCLGAMAAVAVPRQRDVTAQARRTESMALAQSISSAARFGHSLWQAGGGPDVLQAGRGPIAIVNGYPAADDLPLLLEEPETMAFDHAGGAWQHRGLPRDRRCGVSYAPPAQPDEAPVVRLNVAGC